MSKTVHQMMESILKFLNFLKNRFHTFSLYHKFFQIKRAGGETRTHDLPRPLSKPTVGIEPTTCCLRNSCSTTELSRHKERDYSATELARPKRDTGIEPVSQPWEGCIEPLN